MRKSGRTILGIVVAGALLASCSGDGDDKPITLPPATTATTSGRPSTTTPTTPTSLPTPTTTLVLPDQHAKDADAFVIRFFDALNGATSTGDFTAFDAMYLPQCSGCAEYRAELQGWLANNQSIEGGSWTVLQQNSKEVLDGTRVVFRVLAFRSPVAVRNSAGEAIADVPATDVLLGTGGLIADDPWIVEDMSLSPPPLG